MYKTKKHIEVNVFNSERRFICEVVKPTGARYNSVKDAVAHLPECEEQIRAYNQEPLTSLTFDISAVYTLEVAEEIVPEPEDDSSSENDSSPEDDSSSENDSSPEDDSSSEDESKA
jgi:hypothetical protein